MEANTLYYTFSVIPQVTGAIAAIIGTFTHFRIANLKEYLIGDGKVVLLRWGEVGYVLPDEENQKQMKRLRDAIERRSIAEIKNVIYLLNKIEKSEGYTKKDRPTGLQYVYEDRFSGTENQIKLLKKWTLIVIIMSLISIVVSIVSLATIDAIMYATYCYFKYFVLWTNIILFIASVLFAFYLILLGLSEKTVHETDRQLLS